MGNTDGRENGDGGGFSHICIHLQQGHRPPSCFSQRQCQPEQPQAEGVSIVVSLLCPFLSQVFGVQLLYKKTAIFV